ncbi:streptophobe family protein [Actinophytocola xanthii]|uniref:Integral membrane protein n=1 Tax=Actinophytocola xanthii TaxID=1912961 RepID=A0A1Q8CNG9_9PSEU|nr:streptophobe family protein [Actinophytocola xanthii]OLF15907.1 hypothetical protein BU204_19545 [Actinophytocola xanthii]
MGRPGPGWAVLEGAAAGLAAVVVMAGLCAFGLAQLGAEEVPAMTAAAVALAVGGSVDLTASASGQAAELGAGLHGTAQLMPLGVSLVGAAVLVLAFWAPVRRRTPAAEELATRAFAAAAAFLASVAVLALLGRGRLPLAGLGLRAGRDRPGRGLPPGLAERLEDRARAGGPAGEARFSADVAAAVGAGLLWVLVVLAVGWLVSGRGPLPPRWTWAHRLRPAVTSTVLVLVVLAGLATAAGLVLGLVGRNGSLAGGVLFAGATGVLALLGLGLGVPWSASASGPMTSLVPPDRLPDGVLDAGGWPATLAFAAVTLLVTAVLTARHDRDAGEGPRWLRAATAGLRHGLVVAAALAVATLLAGASVEFGVSVLGSQLMGAELRLSGNVLLTLVLGFVAGAAAGAVGRLAVDLARRRSPSTVDS